MKLSEIKGEKAIDMLADLLDPITEILADQNVAKYLKADDRLRTVKEILKNHKKSMIEVMAILEEKDPETYSPSLIEIPVKLLMFLNDPALRPFFASQGQKTEEASFGSAMANTGATGEE